MACAKGCCATQAAHYASIRTSINPPAYKTTTDVHENGGVVSHTVDVTERHDGQDVAVKLSAPAVRAATATNKEL